MNVSIQNVRMASQVGTKEGFGDFLVRKAVFLLDYQAKGWMVGRYIHAHNMTLFPTVVLVGSW